MNCLIVIPALNPAKELIEYVDTLLASGYGHILVVDDGSREDCRFIFDEISKKTGCTILRHEVNLGKGRALKDAMLYYLENHLEESLSGIITVDSDGQHIVPDVNKVEDEMTSYPNSLILGARDFNSDHVPSKSKFGNKCTIVALKLFIGGNIHDTQTGLRGIPNSLIKRFSTLHGDRFEYETVMLIDAIHSHEDIREVPIETVYINGNSETHFHPVIDSIKIYRVILGTFFRYTLSSLSSFLVDYGIFCGLMYVLAKSGLTGSESRSIWISTIVARICSSMFNYLINKKVVFKSDRGSSTLVMYYTLCVVQMAASAALVSLLNMTGFAPQIGKIIVDTLLFIISFRIQKLIIFK